MRSPVPTRLRLMNKVRAHLDASFLSDAVLALPSVYYIGLCAVCNIRCPIARARISPMKWITG
ncbi:MAG TPA: hypothetical protein P5128_10805 [Candidatus Sumerlaeia bacterium]|nr:hypothetical protein [Candidatus Sumerlaeia bacterium]